jgi:tetratricopeptide (TPR) repeat protein
MAVAADNLFPDYIPRDEERAIVAAVDHVRDTGNSEALLLYGLGGVGKTWLVRELPARQATADAVTWLHPIDLDDHAYWQLPALQDNVAGQLDPRDVYFGPYTKYARPLSATDEFVTTEAQASRLGNARRIFLECYANYVTATGKTVVMAFDTVEAVRGNPLLTILTQWMKSLPGTLFILSGRPMPNGGGTRTEDPIRAGLTDPHRPMRVATIELGEFTHEAAEQYLAESRAGTGLDATERSKIILLTRGHPLWLALAVAHLDNNGLPEEAAAPLTVVERELPYRAVETLAGRRLHDDFIQRLLAPYQETDYWHEGLRRLAAVRQGVVEVAWRELMADLRLPDSAANPAMAWEQLKEIPWVRKRASGSAVTLHDALAEALARRVIPIHDQSQEWRMKLWRRMVVNCDRRIEEATTRFKSDQERLESRRQLVSDREPLVTESDRLDAEKRTIDQLKAQRFHYQLLSDFADGCAYFLGLFRQAEQDQDLLFQDLLATAMLRYLSVDDMPTTFDDVDTGVIRQFSRWLKTGEQATYRAIGIVLGRFLIASGHAEEAAELLTALPSDGADAHQLSDLLILLSNAYLRVHEQVGQALHYLDEALQVAGDPALAPSERLRLFAAAWKERGFYHRSVGQWQLANEAYEHALDSIMLVSFAERTDGDRAELASIQTNWAYVKALGGFYRDGLSLVGSAVEVRDRFGLSRQAAISRSTQGEVYRYQQQFQKAWDVYKEAEQSFERLQDTAWLGTIYQQQAICLYQAHLDDLALQLPPPPAARAALPAADRQLALALELAEKAVGICRDLNIRGYPSALNRAGRIRGFGYRDYDRGLRLLAEGIDQGRTMLDGWFWLANLVEYAELAYRAWVATQDQEHREAITRNDEEFARATAVYSFPDLEGRWEIVRGHLAVREWGARLDDHDDRLLEKALEYYTLGFRHIADRGFVGSSGSNVVPGAFVTFGELFRLLPLDVQAHWLDHLRIAWSGSQPGSTMLLAQLERLY